MTISIPDDLQRRMHREKDVNWSAVATSAFEAKLEAANSVLRELEVNKTAEVLRNAARRLTNDELESATQRRQMFLEQLGYQAEWRDQKAKEYPQDTKRNEHSAACLRRLAERLDSLPPSDLLWVRYSNIWDHPEAADTSFVEHEHEALRQFGFYEGGSSSNIRDEDAMGWLKNLVEELEQLLAKEMVGEDADRGKMRREFEGGLQKIDWAIRQELSRVGIKRSTVGFSRHQSHPPEATFEIIANKHAAEKRFSYEDISDSWNGVTASVIAEVRALVARVRR
jgi:hypothetical protein